MVLITSSSVVREYCSSQVPHITEIEKIDSISILKVLNNFFLLIIWVCPTFVNQIIFETSDLYMHYYHPGGRCYSKSKMSRQYKTKSKPYSMVFFNEIQCNGAIGFFELSISIINNIFLS